jgi:hypothetical protein
MYRHVYLQSTITPQPIEIMTWYRLYCAPLIVCFKMIAIFLFRSKCPPFLK